MDLEDQDYEEENTCSDTSADRAMQLRKHTREAGLLEKSHQTLGNCRPQSWLPHALGTLAAMNSVNRLRECNITQGSLDFLQHIFMTTG